MTLAIVSFSSALLSAINKVNATRALSARRLPPSLLYKISFSFKNQRKRDAAIRLFPSIKDDS